MPFVRNRLYSPGYPFGNEEGEDDRNRFRLEEKIKVMYQERVQLAVDLRKQGYNCCQCVVGAFGDLYGFTREQSLAMSSAFGHGIGGMKDICGAAMGLFMLAGLETGTTRPKDPEGQGRVNKLVQELAQEFVRRNGALRCGDLLALPKPPAPETPNPDAEGKYYLNPCILKIQIAAEIWCETLDRLRKA